MIDRKYIRAHVLATICFSFAAFCSEDDPIVKTLTFGQSDEEIPILKSQYDAMSQLRFMLTDMGDQVVKNFAQGLLIRDKTVPRMVKNLFLPLIDYSLQAFPKSLEDYDSIILFFREIKNSKDIYKWDYIDLKNAWNIAALLGVKSSLERAFFNCCYDEKPAYLEMIKNEQPINYPLIKQGEDDFTKGGQNLLRSLLDLPDLTLAVEKKNPYFTIDGFNFRNCELRTLKGLDTFIGKYKRPLTYEKVFDFRNNFIQEVDELFEPAYQDLFKNNKIYLDKNRLSDKAKELCNLKNEAFHNQYGKPLLEYEKKQMNQYETLMKDIWAEEAKIQSRHTNTHLYVSWAIEAALVLGAIYKLSHFFADKIVKFSPSVLSHYFKNSRFGKFGLQLFLVGAAALGLRKSGNARRVLDKVIYGYGVFHFKIIDPIFNWIDKDLDQASMKVRLTKELIKKKFDEKKPKFDFYILYDE